MTVTQITESLIVKTEGQFTRIHSKPSISNTADIISFNSKTLAEFIEWTQGERDRTFIASDTELRYEDGQVKINQFCGLTDETTSIWMNEKTLTALVKSI